MEKIHSVIITHQQMYSKIDQELPYLFMIFKVILVLINSSLLNQSELIILELSHSLLEHIGNIPHGLNYHLVSLLKIKIIFKLVIIKLIQDHQLDVILEKTLMFYYHSELILEEKILNLLLIFMVLKSHLNQSQEVSHLSKFNSLIIKLMVLVLP